MKKMHLSYVNVPVLILCLFLLSISSTLGLQATGSSSVSSYGLIRYTPLVFANVRGVNIIGYDIYDSKLSSADFQRIRSWGCNAVQFHLLWHLIEPKPETYNEQFLLKIGTYIGWAKDQNLWVVLKIAISETEAKQGSWISEDNLWKNATVQARFYELWKMIVNRFKSFDNVMAWNLLNEPGSQASNITLAKKLWNGGVVSTTTISAIRRLDNRTIIFMPAPCSSKNFKDLKPIPFDNIVYATSFYEPYAVTDSGQEYDGNYDYLNTTFAPVKRFSSTYNVQVWIQEFGINIDSCGGEPPSESRVLWVQDVCKLSIEQKVGWMYWLYSYGSKWSYALLNSDGSERTVVGILKEALTG